MKVVLLTLSGSAEDARDLLSARYPGAEIIDYPRGFLEAGSFRERLKNLRMQRPDVWAVSTESLEWQYGQTALMLFGALAGAGESLILDSRSKMRSANRFTLLAAAPFQIMTSYARGKRAVSVAKEKLASLEGKMRTRSQPRLPTHEAKISVAYLRTTPAPGTQPGGATSHINGVVKGLLRLGASITFVSNDSVAGLDTGSVRFQQFPPEPDVMPRSAFDIYNGQLFSVEATKFLASSRPDLIYQRYVRFSWAGVEASLATGAPLFLEYNGSEVWIGKNWDRTEQLELLERYEMLNLNAATRIFVISEVEKSNLLERGVRAEKIDVNPNAVDPDEFRPGIGGDLERKSLGVAENETLAGFVGSFGPWHGVEALAAAIALIPRDLAIRFLMVGDGSLRPEVERRLRDSGDLDRVLWTGVVSHKRVPVLLDACDILISPHVPFADGSEFFGSPTKLFEYMAMGKGIVASRLGQIGEVLTDGETAILTEPGNAAELSDAIQKLARDRQLRERLGSAARQAAVERHTWKHNANRILETYRSLGGLDG